MAEEPLAERAALLDAACGDDRELRADVELLLAADSKGTQAISAAIAGEAALLTAATGPGVEGT